MTLGVDYPWTHPSPAALAAAGAEFAMRYLSTDHTKNLTRAEADALAARGIWSGVVWETTAGRALNGWAAGAADARAAVGQAAACGMPDSRPIYFAVDTDTTWDKVLPYFQGVASVLPATRVGVYGGIRIVAAAATSGLVDWYWQASAWSGGRWDPRAHIRQLGYITIGGVQCDRNESMAADYGQWMPGGRTPITEEDPLAAFTRADLLDIVTEAASSVTVRDANAYAMFWWLGQALDGNVPDGAGAGWAGLLGKVGTALNSLPDDAKQTIRDAVTAALADSTVRVHVDVTTPTTKES
jgi:hypothetical protein